MSNKTNCLFVKIQSITYARLSFFLWFKTEINQILSSPKKTMVNIYLLLEWIKRKKTFSGSTPSFFADGPRLFRRSFQDDLPPVLKNYGKSSTLFFFHFPLQLDTRKVLLRSNGRGAIRFQIGLNL